MASEGISSHLILTILLVDGGHFKCHGVIYGDVTNAEVMKPLGNEKSIDLHYPYSVVTTMVNVCPVCHLAR